MIAVKCLLVLAFLFFSFLFFYLTPLEIAKTGRKRNHVRFGVVSGHFFLSDTVFFYFDF